MSNLTFEPVEISIPDGQRLTVRSVEDAARVLDKGWLRKNSYERLRAMGACQTAVEEKTEVAVQLARSAFLEAAEADGYI